MNRSGGSVRPKSQSIQANPVATISVPTRLSGRRYQAWRPTPTKPPAMKVSSAIQKL